jgi:DNA invertase Pin-like site-specific DNA recombinase
MRAFTSSCFCLVNLVHNLTRRGIGLKVLASQGANLDTTTANGRLIFGIFAALAEFERELIKGQLDFGVDNPTPRCTMRPISDKAV